LEHVPPATGAAANGESTGAAATGAAANGESATGAAVIGAAATGAATTGAATNGEPATGEVEGPPGDSVLIQLLEARRLLIELLDCELNPLVPLLMDGSMIHSTPLVSESWSEPSDFQIGKKLDQCETNKD
jgi:hypothetical protein